MGHQSRERSLKSLNAHVISYKAVDQKCTLRYGEGSSRAYLSVMEALLSSQVSDLVTYKYIPCVTPRMSHPSLGTAKDRNHKSSITETETRLLHTPKSTA